MTLAETRAKYSADELEALGEKGHAFKNPDGSYSYPIDDVEDLKNAILAVGRGNADHNAIRKYVMGRADDLGQKDLIPENWQADGSLAEEKSAPAGSVTCATCDGTGSILEGNRECPDCDGTGWTPGEMNSSRKRVKPRHRHRRSGPPLGREFRHFAAEGLEVRNASDSDSILVSGVPIVYNAPYAVRDMFGTFEETMLPGVANDVLARGADVRFLFNHDGMPLARTLAGTLTLDVTNTRGLPMTATLDARQFLANDLAVAIERGDVNQMSCGFCVGADDWNDAGDERSISKFSDLFDVSAVTYPASPTTSIELAYRSILARPPESQARVRQLWVAVGRDFREGKMLSAENAGQLQAALDALHTADDVDIPAIVRGLQTIDSALDAGQAGLAAVLGKANPDGDPKDLEPALTPPGARSVPATAGERRAAMSDWYSDRQSAVSNALMAKYGKGDTDPWCDLWVQDCNDTEVVFQSWEDSPGVGTWQVGYTVAADGTVTLTGEPVEVTVQTSYVPVTRSVDPSLVALELEAEQLRLHGQRRRAA